MKSLLVVATVALLGCSSSEGGGAPAPTACKQTDRTGTYRQSFQLQTGDCGKLDDAIVSFDNPTGSATPGTTCDVKSERWSDSDCKLERTIECTTPDGVTNAAAVTSQQTQDGSSLAGVFTVSVRLKSGATCTGTYGITATRQ